MSSRLGPWGLVALSALATGACWAWLRRRAQAVSIDGRILEALQDAAAPLTRAALGSRLDCPEETVAAGLLRLETRGRVTYTSSGWSLRAPAR